EYANALADYDEVIRRNPRRFDYYSDRGAIYLDMKQYTSAIADLSETIRLDPENAAAPARLAWIPATCPNDELRDRQRAVECASQETTVNVTFEVGRTRRNGRRRTRDPLATALTPQLLNTVELSATWRHNSSEIAMKTITPLICLAILAAATGCKRPASTDNN